MIFPEVEYTLKHDEMVKVGNRIIERGKKGGLNDAEIVRLIDDCIEMFPDGQYVNNKITVYCPTSRPMPVILLYSLLHHMVNKSKLHSLGAILQLIFSR